MFVDSEDGLRVPVKLLDCDTMSQIKEKLLDATFKVSVYWLTPKLNVLCTQFVLLQGTVYIPYYIITIVYH